MKDISINSQKNSGKWRYFVYWIPGEKVGCTTDLKKRVEKIQGYSPLDYSVVGKFDCCIKASKFEIYLQELRGLPVDSEYFYKTVYKSNKNSIMKITEKYITFYASKDEVTEEFLKDLGHIVISKTKYPLENIEKNVIDLLQESRFNKSNCYMSTKAFKKLFAHGGEIDFEKEPPNVFDKIRKWADDRGIYESGDVKTQFVKLSEEFGELAEAILDGNAEAIKDGIGDMVVVLTNLAHMCDDKIEDCVDHAWNEIKDRKGKMENGTFVKG